MLTGSSPGKPTGYAPANAFPRAVFENNPAIRKGTRAIGYRQYTPGPLPCRREPNPPRPREARGETQNGDLGLLPSAQNTSPQEQGSRRTRRQAANEAGRAKGGDRRPKKQLRKRVPHGPGRLTNRWSRTDLWSRFLLDASQEARPTRRGGGTVGLLNSGVRRPYLLFRTSSVGSGLKAERSQKSPPRQAFIH